MLDILFHIPGDYLEIVAKYLSSKHLEIRRSEEKYGYG